MVSLAPWSPYRQFHLARIWQPLQRRLIDSLNLQVHEVAAAIEVQHDVDARTVGIEGRPSYWKATKDWYDFLKAFDDDDESRTIGIVQGLLNLSYR